MLTQKVKTYISNHQLCPEYLFDDWVEFLELLYEEGGCVESILWFEHVRIIDQKDSLGGGGYRDKTNPEYMYAETHLFKDGLETNTLAEIKEYIIREKKAGFRYGSKYKSHNLVPSFQIAD